MMHVRAWSNDQLVSNVVEDSSHCRGLYHHIRLSATKWLMPRIR
jgi:hypothetical protein